jgi:hypothetical protein
MTGDGGTGWPDVRTGEALAGADGCEITLHGRYTASAQPVRGGRGTQPVDRAFVLLADGTQVWLEPLDQPASVRPDSERQLDGVAVRVRGRAHRIMPAIGQSLLAPCLTAVHDLEPEPRANDASDS